MKILYLNGILTVPNDVGYDKLAQAKEDKGTKKPNWADLGLPSPKDEVEYDEDGLVILEDEYLEEVLTSINIVLSSYAGAEDSLDGGCMVYTTNGLVYRVFETADEVANYAEMLDMSWFERAYIFLKLKIHNIFNKTLTE